MKKIRKSPNINENYAARIVEIKESDFKKHPNADKLKIVEVGANTVITSIDAKPGLYVYFPVESKLSSKFLHETNSYKKPEQNKDNTKAGFFEDKGRVKAIRLRQIPSMGYIVPIQALFDVYGVFEYTVNETFDMIKNEKIVEKYVVKTRVKGRGKKNKNVKQKISRLVEGQVHLHVDTTNLRNVSYVITPIDFVSITYKVHGTSGWTANVLVKAKRNLFEKLFGLNKNKTVYDYVYGSLKVIKNKYKDNDKSKNHFYNEDIWGIVKDELKDKIPKGYTLYYEITGYLPTGQPIQNNYDYGSPEGEHKVWVYRITQTNPDGEVTDLSYSQITEFCEKRGLEVVFPFYEGYAGDLYPEIDFDEDWYKNYVKALEKDFTEKDCFLHNTGVPEEGIVIRKDRLYGFEAYKLKSFRFLELEDEELDKGEENIEDLN